MAKIPNAATARRIIMDAEKALAASPGMWPGARASFKRSITIAKKWLDTNGYDDHHTPRKTNPIDAARLKYEAALKASTRTPAPRGRKRVAAKKTVKRAPKAKYLNNPFDEENNYRVLTPEGFIRVPGKAYLANMPIALELPRVAKEKFYVHHSPTSKNTWVVTHDRTGFSLVKGDTKESTLRDATNLLLKIGEEKFFLAVDRALNSFGYSQGVKRGNI